MTELDIYKRALAARTQERDVLQRRLLAEYLVNERLRAEIAAIKEAAKQPRPEQPKSVEPAKPIDALSDDDFRPVESPY